MPIELSRTIALKFSEDTPGIPLSLNKASLGKLGQVPRLCRALVETYGSRLGEPVLCGGAVVMEIRSESELLQDSRNLVADLALSAHQLNENSQRQPPLPLAQAVTHSKCIDLLHSLAQAHDRSKLIATLNLDGQLFELPQLALSAFTQPEPGKETRKLVNLKLIALCIPSHDGNVVLLENDTKLELPYENYDYDLGHLYQMIFTSGAHFSGWAMPSKKGLRAMPGGELVAQPQI